MRTIEQISNEIKITFISNADLRNIYEFDSNKTFDQQFSKVSIEALLIYVVASAIWTIEKIIDSFSKEVDIRIKQAYVHSVAWYHAQCLRFQFGDELIYDSSTFRLCYEMESLEKQIIKFCAIKEYIPITTSERSKLIVKVSKSGKQRLTTDELESFKAYMRKIGAAGTLYDISSADPVTVGFNLTIMRDSLLLRDNADGKSIINNALTQYLNNLTYDGAISSTGVINTILSIPGVIDVKYNNALINNVENKEIRIESASGAFILDSSKMQITMV